MEAKSGLFAAIDKNSDATRWYKQLASQLKLDGKNGNVKPKSILVISAHWESEIDGNNIYVTSQKNHSGLYYDYYGFPLHTYELKYPCSGSPELADRVTALMNKHMSSEQQPERVRSIKCVLDKKRNLDHGVFIPLMLMYPDADIPVVGMSLHGSLDPKLHLEVGRALAPLREEGVLIIGSGQSTHGQFAPGKKGDEQAREFVDALTKTLTKITPAKREEALLHWTKLPHARLAHGKEEHLLPLMVAVGAAGQDQGTVLSDHWAETMSLASYSFS